MERLMTDVTIVGGGPIGIELAAALQEVGVDYALFEAHQIGHTISRWPRHTHFYSTAERIAIAGVPIPVVDQEHITGEQYLAYLRAVVQQFDLRIHAYERVVSIEPLDDGFELRTRTHVGERVCRSQCVVLATGDMAAPNALGIPGEGLPHVRHYLDDPHRYFRRRLLVVGGGNSALEFTSRCWRAGAEVALSYRRSEFNPAFVKGALMDDFETLARENKIAFLPRTTPVEITPLHVTLAPTTEEGRIIKGERVEHSTDFVLLCTGYTADLRLFEQAGVTFEGPPGQVPQFDLEMMETNVPGLYVAGTAASGQQARHKLFIETSHQHVTKIVTAITGQEPTRVNTLVPEERKDFSL